jgi:outer membrane protein assembly factor BamA
LAPIRSNRLFQYSTPKTLFNLAYNYQRRPDYTRTIARASFGYQWKSSEFSTHRINLLDFNLVKMFSYDPGFIASIENLYIRSSYTDHSISSFNYIYTYNTQRLQKRTNYKYLRASFETAGNTLYGYSKLANRPQELTDTLAGGQYKFLGTPFAQYFRADLEYRRCWVLDKYNTVVIRGFGGIAVPYGNSKQVPFERKYFTGGANDIRAWPVRALGPGTYKADPNAFPNQTGDIKLEGNIEYRYKMIGMLEGAFFLDVGNIWSLKDNRPGTEFRLDKFYNELAVGTGTGFRFDFSYVIFRLDVGMKLRDPLRPEGSRWIIGNRPYTIDDFNVNFAIGYPF